MTPEKFASRLFLFFSFIGLNVVLFFINSNLLNQFMVNGVVSPLEYTPESLDLISQRLPFFLSLFFKYRFYWDHYFVGILVYIFMFFWVIGLDIKSRFIYISVLLIITYVIVTGAKVGHHPFEILAEIKQGKPAYVANDRTIMIYGESDVASLYFLRKNVEFISKNDYTFALMNSRKTITIDEILDYYLDSKMPEENNTQLNKENNGNK